MVAFILTEQCMSFVTFYMPASFLPIVAKHKNIDQSYLGIMFSSYAIACVITGPLIGMYIHKIGRRRVIFIACLLRLLASIAMGVLEWVDTPSVFISVFIFGRVLNGAGAMANQTASKSSLPQIMQYLRNVFPIKWLKFPGFWKEWHVWG